MYTSPDRRRADGVVRTTRPVALTNGTIVRNLELVLRDGAIVQATATHGEADLHAELDAYEGARHLGEIALVDHRSRVGELDTLFYNLLLDENAACHIAYGASILGTFEDLPEGLSDDELRGMGVNRAHVHTDLMIGSAEVEVDGLHAGGDAVPLLRGVNLEIAERDHNHQIGAATGRGDLVKGEEGRPRCSYVVADVRRSRVGRRRHERISEHRTRPNMPE